MSGFLCWCWEFECTDLILCPLTSWWWELERWLGGEEYFLQRSMRVSTDFTYPLRRICCNLFKFLSSKRTRLQFCAVIYDKKAWMTFKHPFAYILKFSVNIIPGRGTVRSEGLTLRFIQRFDSCCQIVFQKDIIEFTSPKRAVMLHFPASTSTWSY